MDTNYGSISVLFFTEDSCTGTHTLVPFGVRVDQYTAVITNDMFVFSLFPAKALENIRRLQNKENNLSPCVYLPTSPISY